MFNQANEKYLKKKNTSNTLQVSLSDIVQVESVKEGLTRNVFKDYRPFFSFYKNGVIWQNGSKEAFDAIIWCTGFRPYLNHLKKLNIIVNDKVITKNTRAVKESNLWLVGYGNWTGFASATIYGVGKTAKITAKEIINSLS
ncbi:hypothetical protein [Marinoscillum sp.]|uniref:hypothetical protein n=1 Tax=Marinoscillum sp. TaxID=2024838 RepID=UPI003BA9081E